MIVNGKRKEKFQTHKINGEKRYELHYTNRAKLQRVNISLTTGGKCATSIGDDIIDGKNVRREVSFNKLPDNVKQQVVIAIEYIENNGTPMENDESIFS